ncbi:MAG: hypothetical protein Q7U88_00235, partial [Desulfocapsaceae bacterium]|nr:hypothetical protein [Desulfocapsaceae bacterium]
CSTSKMAFIEESVFMQVRISQIPKNIMFHYSFLLIFQRVQVLLYGYRHKPLQYWHHAWKWSGFLSVAYG